VEVVVPFRFGAVDQLLLPLRYWTWIVTDAPETRAPRSLRIVTVVCADQRVGLDAVEVLGELRELINCVAGAVVVVVVVGGIVVVVVVLVVVVVVVVVGGIVVVVVVVVVAGGAVLLVGGTVGMVGSLMRSAVPCAVSPAPERNASMPAIDGTANSATSSAYSGRLAPRSRRVRGRPRVVPDRVPSGRRGERGAIDSSSTG
jgi:hypothetical protein